MGAAAELWVTVKITLKKGHSFHFISFHYHLLFFSDSLAPLFFFSVSLSFFLIFPFLSFFLFCQNFPFYFICTPLMMKKFIFRLLFSVFFVPLFILIVLFSFTVILVFSHLLPQSGFLRLLHSISCEEVHGAFIISVFNLFILFVLIFWKTFAHVY